MCLQDALSINLLKVYSDITHTCIKSEVTRIWKGSKGLEFQVYT